MKELSILAVEYTNKLIVPTIYQNPIQCKVISLFVISMRSVFAGVLGSVRWHVHSGSSSLRFNGVTPVL